MLKVLISLVLFLAACGDGVGPVAVAADPFAGGRLTPAAAYAPFEDVDEALDRFRREFGQVRSGRILAAESPQFYLFSDVLGQVLVRHVRANDPGRLIDDAIVGLREEAAARPGATDRELVEAALGRMLSNLDPYSAYLGPDDFNDLQAQTKGEFGGLGLELTFDNDAQLVKVVSPIDNTPAARAGIRAGDLISHLDGTSIKGVSLHDAVLRMRGAPGTTIRLTVRAAAEAARTVNITRAIIRIDPVRHRIEASAKGNVAYIRITTFNEQTAEDLDDALTDIWVKTGGRMAGIVLDLRNNPGGLLDEAVDVASRFLDPGFQVVSVRGRNAVSDRQYPAIGPDSVAGLPIVVLVNGGSASASEIVASALQDHRRALLFGTRTYGKGSVQTVAPLGGGDALRLTTARYYRPSGALVDCYGVVPNLEIWTPPSKGPDSEPHQDASKCESDLPAPVPPMVYRQDQLCPMPAPVKGEGGEDDPVIGCAVEALREYLIARR